MADPHVLRSADDYTEIFAGALPTGPAWPRESDSILMKVVAGLMQTWGDVDGRIDDLLTVESDPRFTFEMLPDWESAYALPDPCVQTPLTIEDRRAALVAKITSVGGQSRAFFISSAATLGYTISIYEYAPYTCGISVCGETRPDGGLLFTYAHCGTMECGVDPICTISITGSDEWYWELGAPELRYYWVVKILNTRLTWFRGGTGECGQDHLCEFAEALDLECLIRRWAPAQSVVIFDYSEVGVSSALNSASTGGAFAFGVNQVGSLDFSDPSNSGLLGVF